MKKITEENVKIDKMITDVTDNIIKIVQKYTIPVVFFSAPNALATI